MCMSNITPEQEASLAEFEARLHVRAARDAVCQAKMAWSSLEQLLAWRAASAGDTEGEDFSHESEDNEPHEEVSLWELISNRSANLCGAPETANITEYDMNRSSQPVKFVSADPGMLLEAEHDCGRSLRSLSSNSSLPQRQLSSTTPSYQRLVDLIPQGGRQADSHGIGRPRKCRHDPADFCAIDRTRASRLPKLRLSRSCCHNLCFGMSCCCLPLAKVGLECAGRPWLWFWAAVEWLPCGAGCLLPAASPRSSRSSSADISQQTSLQEVSSTPRVATGADWERGA
eukprot:TRINITY_DN104570_c0_g1_i1.p1 TRINITY_DN104570_c0_g1~~TRINITY_DN104570_c0_g1_i1.p1  ORF type:complete len:286 (+),score=55.72 TRINITY_DN104570_c0_g1_i1:105-962(+)